MLRLSSSPLRVSSGFAPDSLTQPRWVRLAQADHTSAVVSPLLVSGLPTPWFIALLALGFVAGIRICQAATDAIGMPDHGAIVWDEVIGFGVTMIAAPAGWEWVLAGFVLFRLFDVLKPWPISWFDRRIHGGLGIMLDDLIAGLFALLCMQLLARW